MRASKKLSFSWVEIPGAGFSRRLLDSILGHLDGISNTILVRRELSAMRREYRQLALLMEKRRKLIYNKADLTDLPVHFEDDINRLHELEARINEREYQGRHLLNH